MHIFYNDQYVAPAYAFETTRKSKLIAEQIGLDKLTDPSSGVAHAIEEISLVHDIEYIESLQSGTPNYLAESNNFKWDSGIWSMAVNSTAGILAACETAYRGIDKLTLPSIISGSLSSGLHHAHTKGGAGFCTVNGLAVAANAFDSLRIAILDFDAHCGGGTVEILRTLGIDNRVYQYDISTNMYDRYEQDDNHLILISDTDEEYIQDVNMVLDFLVNWDETDLILYNAGVDAYPEISHNTLAHRDELVFNKCVSTTTPCVFTLAGGYTDHQDMDSLVESHMATIYAAQNAEVKPPKEKVQLHP